MITAIGIASCLALHGGVGQAQATPTGGALQLTGRALDETGRPVAQVTLYCTCWNHCGDPFGGGSERRLRGGSYPRTVRTDAGGSFQLSWAGEVAEECSRILSIRGAWHDDEGRPPTTAASAVLDLSALPRTGARDLGDVVLVVPGSSTYLATLDDEALARRYDESRSLASTNGYHWPLIEHCLMEMARRGTLYWIGFLRAEVQEIRDRAGSLHSRSGREALFLTALRRAEGKPDPLRLVVGGGPSFTATYPVVPVIDAALVNTDIDGEVIPHALRITGGLRRDVHLALEVTDASGALLPPLPPSLTWRRDFYEPILLQSGESVPTRVELTQYVEFPGPGEYEVRLLYHDMRSISEAPSSAGPFVIRSEPFTVRLRP